MGTITVRLRMPAVDYVRLSDVEIRFEEEGLLRTLSLDEWKAYFPGCGDPMVYKRVARGSEVVWWGAITDRLIEMTNAAGFLFVARDHALDMVPYITAAIAALQAEPNRYQNLFGPIAVAEDTEPPTVWTLIQFLLQLKTNCVAFPAATVEMEHMHSAAERGYNERNRSTLYGIRNEQ